MKLKSNTRRGVLDHQMNWVRSRIRYLLQIVITIAGVQSALDVVNVPDLSLRILHAVLVILSVLAIIMIGWRRVGKSFRFVGMLALWGVVLFYFLEGILVMIITAIDENTRGSVWAVIGNTSYALFTTLMLIITLEFITINKHRNAEVIK